MGKKSKQKVANKKIIHARTTEKNVVREKQFFLPWLFVLMGITFICFVPMLKNTLTNWDDFFYVENNTYLRGPDWNAIFTKPVVSNYHPLTVLTLALNYAISGTHAWSYLLLNLLLHVINALLVFKFIYSISDKKIWVAFFTAMIFAIHPMHVESVAWISERKDVLYTLFFLLSLMQYWKFLQSGKQKRLWLCFFLFVLSLLSKPAAIILPIILFLLDYWKRRTFHKKLIWEKIPFLLVAVIFTVITLKLQSVTAMTSLDVYPFWVRPFFACYVTMIYLLRFFIPYPLSSFHPFPSPDDLGWAVYLSPVFVLAILFLLWFYRKNRLVIFGVLFFFFNIILVLQLISIGFTIVSERYTYVAYIGLGFLVTMIWDKYIKGKLGLPGRIVISIIFLIFGFISFKRTLVWRDSDTLWTDVIKHYPKASLPRGERSQFNYNEALISDSAKANTLFMRVIEDCTEGINIDIALSKDSIKMGARSKYYMRGNSYFQLKQYQKALADFDTCILINSNDHDLLNNRGSLLFNYFKKYNEALSDFNRAIQISPEGRYFLNRSICYYNLGNIENAKADAQVALEKGVVIQESYRHLLNL